MPTQTSNFSFNKPLVNNPVDEDLWGDQLNTNWDSVDTIIDALMPIGSMLAYAGTTAPNARWLLCDGSAVSRTTYATLFALVSTAYGIGDGSTTFNLPDYRGRAGVGLDNLGGASADRITDANADSLNNTGMGDETPNVTLNSVTLTSSNMPAHRHLMLANVTGAGGGFPTASNQMQKQRNAGSQTEDYDTTSSATDATLARTSSAGSGSSFTPTAINTAGDNLQPSIAEGKIIRVL